jgi:hypothetical protein
MMDLAVGCHLLQVRLSAVGSGKSSGTARIGVLQRRTVKRPL